MTTVASPSLEQRVKSAIRTFTKHKKPFTLLDVSEKMKKDGYGWLSHTVITATARPIADQIPYNRSQITVWTSKGMTGAMLYHPPGYNPQNYDSRDKTASPPPTAIAGHPILTNRATKVGLPSAQKYVEVPREIWSKAGFVEGDDYLIDVHERSLTLYNITHGKYVDKSVAGKDTQQVPWAGRVRISPKYLKQVRLTSKPLSFFTYTDKIVITVNQ
jgi:hypothetical protein